MFVVLGPTRRVCEEDSGGVKHGEYVERFACSLCLARLGECAKKIPAGLRAIIYPPSPPQAGGEVISLCKPGSARILKLRRRALEEASP